MISIYSSENRRRRHVHTFFDNSIDEECLPPSKRLRQYSSLYCTEYPYKNDKFPENEYDKIINCLDKNINNEYVNNCNLNEDKYLIPQDYTHLSSEHDCYYYRLADAFTLKTLRKTNKSSFGNITYKQISSVSSNYYDYKINVLNMKYMAKLNVYNDNLAKEKSGNVLSEISPILIKSNFKLSKENSSHRINDIQVILKDEIKQETYHVFKERIAIKSQLCNRTYIFFLINTFIYVVLNLLKYNPQTWNNFHSHAMTKLRASNNYFDTSIKNNINKSSVLDTPLEFLADAFQVQKRQLKDNLKMEHQYREQLRKRISIRKYNEIKKRFTKLEDDLKNYNFYEVIQKLRRQISFTKHRLLDDSVTLSIVSRALLNFPSRLDLTSRHFICESEEFITLYDIFVARHHLQQFAYDVIIKWRESTTFLELIQKWASKQVCDVLENKHSSSGSNDTKLKKLLNSVTYNKFRKNIDGKSTFNVQPVINTRPENERKNISSINDHASLPMGALIIYCGPQRTSPSSKGNKLWIKSLLFDSHLMLYGRGPEAALISTFPSYSLGKCRSFEGERVNIQILGLETNITQRYLRSQNYGSLFRGAYATLSIKLATSIHVTYVIIEYPRPVIKNLTIANTCTAVRHFHILGFEDDNAIGSPWHLCSSEYYHEMGESSLQTFFVSTVDKIGLAIPKIKSIVIAIDSNWGKKCSCLYRLRVYGRKTLPTINNEQG